MATSQSTPTDQTPNGPNCSCCNEPKALHPTEMGFTNLGDGRLLCPSCLYRSLLEPEHLEPLIRQVHSFFDEYLKLPVSKDIPVFFVDANQIKKNTTFGQDTRIPYGRTMYTGDTIEIIKKCVRRGANIEAVTEMKEVKTDTVAAIVLLFGFPNDVKGKYENKNRTEKMVETSELTRLDLPFLKSYYDDITVHIYRNSQIVGATLVHEMVHALIRLQGWNFSLEKLVEESICEAVAFTWLEYTADDCDPCYTEWDASFAKGLNRHTKCMIETCNSNAEFAKARHAVKKYGLECTLKHVAHTRSIPD